MDWIPDQARDDILKDDRCLPYSTGGRR